MIRDRRKNVEDEMRYIETKVLKESIIAEHFEEFDQEHLERCVDCGSSLFRIYKEPVKEGLYEQMICAVCNHRIGGWLNDFRSQEKEKVDGRICRKCGNELEKNELER